MSAKNPCPRLVNGAPTESGRLLGLMGEVSRYPPWLETAVRTLSKLLGNKPRRGVINSISFSPSEIPGNPAAEDAKTTPNSPSRCLASPPHDCLPSSERNPCSGVRLRRRLVHERDIRVGNETVCSGAGLPRRPVTKMDIRVSNKTAPQADAATHDALGRWRLVFVTSGVRLHRRYL
jgi:hypothetical protein